MHSWQNKLAKLLAQQTPGGYLQGGPSASEPTAWAALALQSLGHESAALKAGQWLASLQQSTGAVGVAADQLQPAWPTSLAMLVWQTLDAHQFESEIQRATNWALNARGKTMPQREQIGHDSTLVGWSWADNTHSWLEPTAMFVAALRAVEQAEHPRAKEGVRLLANRLLPSGGANYGNTTVLGQELLPHVQPTGIVLWALAGETLGSALQKQAIDYLHRTVDEQTTLQSLAFACLGLVAQQAPHPQAETLLTAAIQQELASPQTSCHRLALLAYAASFHPHLI